MPLITKIVIDVYIMWISEYDVFCGFFLLFFFYL